MNKIGVPEINELAAPPEIICAGICANSPGHSEFVQTCGQCGNLIEALEPSRCFYCMALLCWKCWDDNLGVCRGCIADLARRNVKIKAELASMHKSKVGRPKVMVGCPHCGNRFGTRGFRKHKPICAKLTPEERCQ